MESDMNPTRRTTRRSFLKSTLATAAVAAAGTPLIGSLSGCGKQTNATAPRSGDGPEMPDVTFGMIALTDCSPIVIAHEKGFFKKYGINSKVVKPANWAAVRDALVKGDIQGTHMLLGMPIASTIGFGGSSADPMVIPWLLNRNGQAITLKNSLKGKVAADPKALKPYVDEAKAAGNPMTFAMTFPPGTHAMWMRYYLGAGGLNPDRDVKLITIPPPQMVANMKVGNMDGYCVGEPWNARAISDNVGYTSVTTQEMWKDHPEKVCAFMAGFADKNPKTVKAILKGLHEASIWLDDLKNRPEQCEIVSRDAYIKCPKDLILGRLQGKLDYGDGRSIQDPNYMIFHERNCNYPQPKFAKWFLSQYRRWGMVPSGTDYDGIAAKVMRSDIYEEAMKEINYTHGGLDNKPETFFDGMTFDPAKSEEYALSFPVHTRKD